MWGRVKTTGENWMYPKPVLDLRLGPCDYHLTSICCYLHRKLVLLQEVCTALASGSPNLWRSVLNIYKTSTFYFSRMHVQNFHQCLPFSCLGCLFLGWSGWNIRSMDCGNTSSFCSSWGFLHKLGYSSKWRARLWTHRSQVCSFLLFFWFFWFYF